MLATSAETLLKQNISENTKFYVNDRPYVAGGLYTYAIEEYGKVLFLLERKSLSKNIIINHKKFTHHKPKFKRALEKLPEECKIIHIRKTKSSSFSTSEFDTVVDFEARKAIFYSDFDKDGVKKLPDVDNKKLDTALKKFINIIETELEGFNKTFPIH